MNNWLVSELMTDPTLNAGSYHEFVRVAAMSAGMYSLAKGSADTQRPHTEDELYYVVQGHANIRVDDAEISVQPGSLIFVAAHQTHYFHSILEDLNVLVFFAPAEYANRAAGSNG